MKQCSACQKTKKNKEFYSNKGKLSSKCKSCARAYQLKYTQELGTVSVEKPREPEELQTTLSNPKELCMKRMLSGAKARAKDKGVDFNIDYSDIQMPNLCPVLKIPLVPNSGSVGDSSPTLDRLLPHLGYTKGNVKVISSLANRIKTNATSAQIRDVANYVQQIEENNV